MSLRLAHRILVGGLIVMIAVSAGLTGVRAACAMTRTKTACCCPPSRSAPAAKHRAPPPTGHARLVQGDCCGVAEVGGLATSPTIAVSAPESVTTTAPVTIAVVAVEPARPTVRWVPDAVAPPPRPPRQQAQIWLL